MVLLSMVGCLASSPESGPLTELTVVALATEPPQPVAGRPVTVHAVVANPDELDVEVLLWTCVRVAPNRCAETDLGLDLAQRTRVLAPQGARVDVDVQLPAIEPDEVAFGDELRIAVFALACEVGRCEVLEALRDPPSTDSEISSWLDDLDAWPDAPGFGEAHLGYRAVTLELRVPREPNRPPRIVDDGTNGSGWLWVDLVDPDDDELSARAEVTTGSVELSSEPGQGVVAVWSGDRSGRLFLVIEDGDDGVVTRVWPDDDDDEAADGS